MKRAVVEARILKWFRRPRRKNPLPSRLLTQLTRPKRGMHVSLTREERVRFTSLIRDMYGARNTVRKYRKQHSRRPRLFYEKVFGFRPRPQQPVKIIWSPFNVHFIFRKNDLMAFWRRVGWGPGSGGYYSVGDRDIKIKELRGLVSFGRESEWSIETREIIRHESVHAFEDYVKKRPQPWDDLAYMRYRIKSELNAYLHNFRDSRDMRWRIINENSRRGLAEEVREQAEDYLSYTATAKKIRALEKRRRRAKTKKERRELGERVKRLRKRLEKKRMRIRDEMSLYRKTVNQVKKALKAMPLEALQHVIYATPYTRLHVKIPEAVREYRRMRREWYG